MVRLTGHDPERQDVVTRRTTMIGAGIGLVFSGIAARLYQLQIIEFEKYSNDAYENQFNRQLITPLRGEVIDRYGVPLATNRKNFRVLFIPEKATNVNETLSKIGEIVEISDAKRARILRKIRRSGAFTPVEVEDNLSWEDFSKVNFALPHLPGALPEIGETRDYPFGAASAFVVGYVGAVTDKDLANQVEEEERKLLRQPGFKVGRDGLERTFDKELRGEAGNMRVKVNAHGRVIAQVSEGVVQPQQGSTLALTIDAELQQKAMQVLGDESGAAVVMDVVTGDILVSASTPAFNPNDFNVGINPTLWKELNASPYKPLLNKPLSGVYPPGSTFKMISAIAAQEMGIDPEETTYCSGKMWYGKRYFHCWKRGGHGRMNLKNALKHSCDTYFYEIAKRLDIDLLADVARRFGLGETYDLGMSGQQAGVIPDREWKRAYFTGNPEQQPWFQGETLSCIIGQGYVTSTPLQLAVMAARVATGQSR